MNELQRSYLALATAAGNELNKHELLEKAESLSSQYYEELGCPGTINSFLEDKAEVAGAANISIVGIRYYRGRVYDGELVNLVREPSNMYDRNAIRVDNMNGTQVGHIKRETAAILSQVYDRSSPWKLRFEALVPTSYGNGYTITAEMSVICLPIVMPLVKRWMETTTGLYFNVARQHGGRVDVKTEVVAKIKSQQELDTLLEANEKAQENIEATVPAQHALMMSQLYPFQVLGVSWMLKREKSGTSQGETLPPLWSHITASKYPGYFNEITNSIKPDPPPPVKGGILADEMGLGKTLQVLALMVNHPPPDVLYKETDESHTEEPSSKRARQEEVLSPVELRRKQLLKLTVPALKKEVIGFGKKVGRKTKKVMVETILECEGLVSPNAQQSGRGTLLIVPKGLMHNWQNEITKHVRPGVLKSMIYHGPDRASLNSTLHEFDVVITTVGTLSQEHKSGQTNGLLQQKWWRVVIDEAHEIRNRNTQGSQAVKKLDSVNRWCLTGTPFYNSVEDLQSLLAFLNYQPINDYSIFRRTLGRPLLEGNESAIMKFRVILTSLMLRRRKEMVLKLPPIRVEMHLLALEGAQKRKYDLLHRSTRLLFKTVRRAGGDRVMKEYMLMLEAINRMRQVCLDAALVPDHRFQAAERLLDRFQEENSTSAAPLTPEEALKLFEKLKEVFTDANSEEEEEASECVICLCVLEQDSAQVLRGCMHTFCEPCLRQWQQTNPKCPLCRASFTTRDILSVKDLLHQPAEKGQVGSEEAAPPPEEEAEVPVKVRALLQSLKDMAKSDPDARALVVSTFTGFLDVIAKHLELAGIQFGRIDGRVSARKRQMEQDAFQQAKGGPLVLLISLKAGGQGLTLTRANHVFMVDPWWSLSSENQAYDRVHRIGQSKPVKVVRFVIQNSIEERVLHVQEKKSHLAKTLLEKKKKQSAEEVRAQRLEHLNLIFAE